MSKPVAIELDPEMREALKERQITLEEVYGKEVADQLAEVDDDQIELDEEVEEMLDDFLFGDLDEEDIEE